MTDTRTHPDWRSLAERITAALKPAAAPIAIRFKATPSGVGRFSERAYPAPSPEGRTGAVAAGCMFWLEASARAFETVPADHGNCSVGSYTHGLLGAAEATRKDDVAAIVSAGWVSDADLTGLPRLTNAPSVITYGPLAESEDPDVVLLRLNGLALMTVKDAFPELAISGKPQCHIIPHALLSGAPSASVGCALSRARTGMRPEEMTCAVAASGFEVFVERVEAALALDRAMARYAAQDAKRFSQPPS